MKNVIVKKSKISGKGVFSLRNFKKGEVVLKWSPKFIKKDELKKISKKQKAYINWYKNRYMLMQSPEKYMNHSCEANTKVLKRCDIATRNIKKGEEITSDYKKELKGKLLENFTCKCGSRKCRKNI